MRHDHNTLPRVGAAGKIPMAAVGALLLCVFFAVVGGSRVHSAPPAHQVAMLADGTVVTLEGVTYGRERRFGGMSIEQIPGTGDATPDTQDAIILWTRAVRPAAGRNARVGFQPGPIHIFDDAGKECISCESVAQARYLPNNGHAFMLYAWPRRSAEFSVEISYSYDPRHPAIVKFRVANPHPVRTPPYTPMPAPITRRDADLEVTLDGLHQMPPPMYRGGPIGRQELENRLQPLHTMASFRMKFHGQPTQEWIPTEALITDSTGNAYNGEASNLYQPGRYPLTYYRSDRDEPLKIGAWFHRTANATFAPQETMALNNLPMRLGSYLRTPGATARLADVTLEMSEIGEVECVGKRTMVKLNVYGGDPHLALLMQVRNERGKSANGIGPNEQAKWITGAMRAPEKFRDEETANPAPHRCAEFLMDLPRGTSRISLTIAVNRSHFFEFTPTPTVLHDLPAR